MRLERLGNVVGQFGIGLDQSQKATRLVGRKLVDQVMQFVVRRSRHPTSLRQTLYGRQKSWVALKSGNQRFSVSAGRGEGR